MSHSVTHDHRPDAMSPYTPKEELALIKINEMLQRLSSRTPSAADIATLQALINEHPECEQEIKRAITELQSRQLDACARCMATAPNNSNSLTAESLNIGRC